MFNLTLSHFLATDSSLGANVQPVTAHPCCDQLNSCQNIVSADHCPLTVSQAQVSTHRGRVFLKLSADKLQVFKCSQDQVQFF